ILLSAPTPAVAKATLSAAAALAPLTPDTTRPTTPRPEASGAGPAAPPPATTPPPAEAAAAGARAIARPAAPAAPGAAPARARAASNAERMRAIAEAAAAQQPAQADDGDTRPASPAAADALAAEEQAAAAEPERGELFRGVTGGVGPVAPADSGARPDPDARREMPAPRVIMAPAPQPAPPSGAGMDAAYLLSLVDAGKEPLRNFLIKHSNGAERAFFLRSAERLLPPERQSSLSIDDFIVVIPAFTVSELTAAFQIGFL